MRNLGRLLSYITGLFPAATLALITATPIYAFESPDGQAFSSYWQTRLEQAVCLQDWNKAVQSAGSLMASGSISDSYRAFLVSYRHQLLSYQSLNFRFERIVGCEPILTRLAQTTLQQPQEEGTAETTFDWATAIAQLEERLRRRVEAAELPDQPMAQTRPRSAVVLQRGPVLDRDLRDRTLPCRSRLSLCDR